MYRKARYHRTHLYPYAMANGFSLNLPSILSSLSPLALPPRRLKPALRKVRLIPLAFILPLSPPAS